MAPSVFTPHVLTWPALTWRKVPLGGVVLLEVVVCDDVVEREELPFADDEHVRERLHDDAAAVVDCIVYGDQSLSPISPGPWSGVVRLGVGFGMGRAVRTYFLTAV